ncbi:hypothetical protein Tsubulata_009590 [Turnera subulata]|uniref:Rhamnogalacturonan endolyase n=1 Tax=Turnera subulata TaxID=218843 RepID=A0A9Q0GIT5_9ROSI|nr:hypothetical protein Tsubulata_009590 [Turnera subulata]
MGGSQGGVQLLTQEGHVVLDNGILQVTLSNPAGSVTGIQYNGVDNLLEVLNDETNRGYWDLVWTGEGIIRKKGALDRLEGTNMTVVVQTEDKVELSFTRTWDLSLQGKVVPLNFDKRYVMLRGSSGFYTYAIYEHLKGYPAFVLANTRVAFKLRKDKFHYMAIGDNRQRYMPLPDDRIPPRGQPLAYPEAVSLVDPIEPEFKGEVDDKYEYSCDGKDSNVHGWVSSDPPVGFWQITPSAEFRTGGPTKQLLTSHVFHSTHYVGKDVMPTFSQDEQWKKVELIPFHCGRMLKNRPSMKFKAGPMTSLLQKISFPRLKGVLNKNIPAQGAYVGLAAPGDIGSWQLEAKGYQFWTQVDGEGLFTVKNIRPGDYNLYATIAIGDLIYNPPKSGSTLWEIGVPDRTAAEFFVPDTNPRYINKLYINHDKKTNNNTYEGTTWQIKFQLDTLDKTGTYKLWLALATANVAELQVRVNDPSVNPPLFTTGVIGKDNTIARHGIHGVYRLFNVVLDNGILQVTLSNPAGQVTGIQYNGVDNLLDVEYLEDRRGYWDLVWSEEGVKKGELDGLKGTKMSVVVENEDKVELSFTRTWDPSLRGKVVPLNLDKRFVMVRGSSGFYTYAIYEHLKGWPAFQLHNTRVAFKLRKERFHYMAVADNIQRYMPAQADREPPRGQPLAYPEAVDDKYEYSADAKDNIVHGWVSSDPAVGFWQITPSSEFRTGGPPKQLLTSHAIHEVQSWPYNFFASKDFLSSAQRGTVSGRLLVRDSNNKKPAEGAYVGLAAPGEAGSWQLEAKGYQFWTTVHKDGSFTIKNIRPGQYNLYAYVPGGAITTGDLIYEPPRNGSTLWEIGIPDRSAAEFFVPDTDAIYVNKLYYGLWERYAELYPRGDLVFTVGSSNYKTDWFFAQVTRKTNNKYQGTTWQIKFQLTHVDKSRTYKLRLALASANLANLEVRVNDPSKNRPLFSTGTIGKDNAIARHGIHGIYRNCLTETDMQWKQVVMDNGILQVTLSKPDGIVTGIQYNGISNLLEVRNEESNRGYWDLVWSKELTPGTTGISYNFKIKGTSFRVIVENEEQVEISFTRTWDPSQEGQLAPLNIDKRFIMLRNSSGFYSYAIYEHLEEWPAFNLPQTRIVFKLRKDKFHFMAVADNRQRFMPLPEDRLPRRSKFLAVPEAVLLVHPVEQEFKGEVDDKYQYSCENKDLRVHGWICSDPPVGFWQITPSNEFRSGGPVKQNLTSHMFLSAHYAGEDMVLKFKSKEPWKKVFGPMLIEVECWPYSFPASEDFLTSDQRGSVCGRLQVRDRYICDYDKPAIDAYVGLAPPGEVGSWQTESKGYQFWTKTDLDGCFSIPDIRPGDYNLCAWIPGCDIDVGDVVYEPPRDGPTLWEIGFPDRSAAGFYVPDPDPKYINKLYYGLWDRYTDLYPDEDLVFTVGTSDCTKDWFFAQVTRRKDENTYEPTTWQIKFGLDNVQANGTYNLRVALATANVAELQVRINDFEADPPLFTTGETGHDNTIARHGIHGLYRLYNIEVPGSQVVEGENIIFLTQAMSTGPFNGVISRRKMATFELYRRSTIGMCLTETLDEMVQSGTLSPELAIQVLVQFDKSMTEALESQVKSKVSIKDAVFKNEDTQENVGRVKIVACDSKLLGQ